MASLPLPQFQASHPNVVQANVINEPAVRYNSFFGQTLPALIQGASAVRSMVEGNPEVEYQKNLAQSKETDSALTGIGEADTEQARNQLLDARIAQFEANGNEAGAAALRKIRDSGGLGMNLKQQAQNKSFNSLNKAVDGSQARIDANNPNAQQQAPAQGQGLQAKQVAGNKQSWTDPSQPGMKDSSQQDPSQLMTNTGSDFMGNVPVTPGQPDPEQANAPTDQVSPTQDLTGIPPEVAHPLQQHADAVAAAIGTTPDKLRLNLDTGISPSTDLVAEGKAPVSALFPPPLPGAIGPQQAQVAEHVGGAQIAPQLTQVVHDYAAANAYANFANGKALTDHDLFAMNLSEAQANSFIQDGQYQLGAANPNMNFKNTVLMADLVANPDNAIKLLNGPNADTYKAVTQAYDSLSPAEKVAINTSIQGLISNKETLSKLSNAAAAQRMKEVQAAQQMQLKMYDLAERSRNNQANNIINTKKLGIEGMNADTNRMKATSEANVNNSRVAVNQMQMGKLGAETEAIKAKMDDNRVNNQLKQMGLPPVDDAMKTATAQQMVAQKQLHEANLQAQRLDSQITKLSSSKPTFDMSGKQITQGMTPEVKAQIAKLQEDRAALDKPEGARAIAQANYNKALSDTQGILKRQQGGAPNPGLFVQDRLHRGEQISPDYVASLKQMYASAASGGGRPMDYATMVNAFKQRYPNIQASEYPQLWQALKIYRPDLAKGNISAGSAWNK